MCDSNAMEKLSSTGLFNFFNELSSSYATEFAGQEGLLSQLTSAYAPIVNAGVGQQGFSPEERAAINTQIGEGVGQNFAKASQQLNNQINARGGGNQFLPNGAANQLNEQLSSAAATTMSNQQLQATEANYQTGRANFFGALQGMSSEAGIYNPTGMANATTGAGTASFNASQMLWQQGNEWVGALGGAVGGASNVAAAAMMGG